MNRKTIKILVVSFMILFLTLTVCSCKGKEVKDENVENNITVNIGLTSGNEMVERAENIADNVVELIGVEDATALIYNEKVIVVVELNQGIDYSEDMKEMIKAVVLEMEPNILNVFISNDEKLFNKVDEIAQNLIKGEDIKNHSIEIEKIIKRIEKTNKNN